MNTFAAFFMTLAALQFALAKPATASAKTKWCEAAFTQSQWSRTMKTEFEISTISADQTAALAEINSIQRSLEIANELLRAGKTEAPAGFLMSSYSESDFRAFLERGGEIRIARNREGKILGYLLTNPGSVLRTDYPNTLITWQSEAERAKFEPTYLSGNFVYLDQIGILLGHHGSGIAQALLASLESEIPGRLIIAAVLQAPLNNVRSHKYFEKMGFSDIGYFYTPKLKGLKDVKSTTFAKFVGADEP